MADTTIVRNNASVDLPSHAPAPSSQLFVPVPVESLTNSPNSSTGSASVLDWNSNSDGEVLDWPFSAPSSPPALTAPSPLLASSTTIAPIAPVESSDDGLARCNSPFEAAKVENIPEPCVSTPPNSASMSLTEQFQLFNLMHNFNTVEDPASSTEATPPLDAANVVEHVIHDDDVSQPPMVEYELNPRSPSLYPNSPTATPDTSLTSNSTILAPGGDSSMTSMTTMSPGESSVVTSSLFLPPRVNSSTSSSVDEANTQGIWYPSFDLRPRPISSVPPRGLTPPSPELQQISSPTPAINEFLYATSEGSTEPEDRIEYQSVPSISPSPSSNGPRPTWSNGFGHDSWLGSESTPSIQHSDSIPSLYVVRDSISPGLFGPRTISPSSRTASPVPEFPVLEERTTHGLHLNRTPALPTSSDSLSGCSRAAPSILYSSSVENGRRGVSQFDIPSWLRAAPLSSPPILKEETPIAVRDTESVRLQYPFHSPYSINHEPLVVQSARATSTGRRGNGGVRVRPPLPTPPCHIQATPQFALRSHSPDSDLDAGANNYFAQALPSRWNGRTSAPPRRSFSPISVSASDSSWPNAQPASPRPYLPYYNNLQDRTRNLPPPSCWTPIPHPRPPHLNGSSNNFIPPSSAPLPSTWGGCGPNNQQHTPGPVLNRDYSSIPESAPPCLNPWGAPAQRRLRFAPLPPTPGNNPNNANTAPRSQPPPPTLPPLYNFQPSLPQQQQPAPVIPPYGYRPGYLYSTPAPVIPLPTAHVDSYPRSPRFWFLDGTVIFRVENFLYSVHRHFFEHHSEHFRKLLGSYWFSPVSHLFLPEIKKSEFERLLSVFYPTDLAKPDITTVEGWTSVLGLSCKYTMSQVESLCIQKLQELATSVQKVAIAKKFNFGKKHHQDWLIPAYVDLCSRDTPLSLEEAEQLDMPTVIMVWNVRHAVKGMSRRGRGVVFENELVLQLVKENWGLGQEDELEEDTVSWPGVQFGSR